MSFASLADVNITASSSYWIHAGHVGAHNYSIHTTANFIVAPKLEDSPEAIVDQFTISNTALIGDVLTSCKNTGETEISDTFRVTAWMQAIPVKECDTTTITVNLSIKWNTANPPGRVYVGIWNLCDKQYWGGWFNTSDNVICSATIHTPIDLGELIKGLTKEPLTLLKGRTPGTGIGYITLRPSQFKDGKGVIKNNDSVLLYNVPEGALSEKGGGMDY